VIGGVSRTKKVLLFVLNDAGFFISHRLPIAVEAQKEGWQVHVATPFGVGVGDIRSAGFAYHEIPLVRAWGDPVREFWTLLAMWRLYRKIEPDIVHHVTIKPVLYGSLAARAAGKSAVVNAISGLGFVFSGTGIRRVLLRKVISRMYRIALKMDRMRVIFQNSDDRCVLERIRAVKSTQVVMIPGSGVDLKEFSPTPEPEGVPVIVLPARMIWEKGVREFVEAARILRSRSVRARFVLVGGNDDGNPSSIGIAILEKWRDEGVVEWWGHRSDMPRVCEESHVIVLPSYYGEGIPKTLIEGCACGRPIVTTDAPGCREVVRDGRNGLLVQAREPEELARAIEWLITNPAERRRMGWHSRKLAEEKFSVDYVVSRHLAVYSELMEEGGSEAAIHTQERQ
jgi:glycosyltransferase involved in cell wall biosynthesis